MAFCDTHNDAFAFFGVVPQTILYDNTKIAAKILGDGKRRLTHVFSELLSHYPFDTRFGRPGRGNDTGKVKVGKVDTDANRNVSVRFSISAIPTVILFNKGEIVEKFVGLKSKQDFQAELDKVATPA